MCGICGLSGRIDEQLVWRMADQICHRGPDGEGVRTLEAPGGEAAATLGHRRLSIIDPTPRGAQPMSYADGKFCITYNGELYNHRELRAELAAEGFPFASDCDTEVLLALYARDGEEMLHRLNGMFAFAIWDSRRGDVFLARDRLGIKPLYYCVLPDGALAFASEAKALLPAIGPVAIDDRAVADYLTFLWVPDPDTMFAGVKKLPPGHCARHSRGRFSIRRYWDLTFDPINDSETSWAADVREEVCAAIRRQMVSDVPLGSFLSGGVDSSAIVAEMATALGGVTTYTVGFGSDDLQHEIVPDDLRYAREVAAQFAVDYNERILDADVVSLLPRLIWHMDDPVADPAAITTYLICSAAREQLTVILSGMGGDEIFAGYPRYLAASLTRPADAVPAALRRRLRATASAHLTLGPPGRLRGPRRNLMKLLRGIDLPSTERYLAYVSYYRPEELAILLDSDFRAGLDGHDPFSRHREHFERVRDEHWLNQLLYVDMKTFLPCLNLAYTDKMSMAASTEVRVPLLDDELVALAARIPPELKLKGMRRKYVFKRSMEGVLPQKVIWRPKAGFGAPIRSWLVGDLAPMVDDLLSPEAIHARGLFSPREVARLVHANREGTEDNALRIWALLTLELWCRRFIDGVTR